MPPAGNPTQSAIRRVSNNLNAASKKVTETSVHDLRTASRRLQSLIRYFGEEDDKAQNRLDTQLDKLRRRAGRVRDLDVRIAALKSLQIGREEGRKRVLLDELERRRNRRARKLERVLDDETLARVRKRMRAAARTLEMPENRAAIRLRAYRELARMAREPLAGEEGLHKFRTRCKNLRYVVEFGVERSEEGELASAIVAQLKRLQDAVGKWHDWSELTQWAEKYLASAPDSALLTALRNVARANLVHALRVANETRRLLMTELGPHSEPAPQPTAERQKAHRPPQPEAVPKKAAIA